MATLPEPVFFETDKDVIIAESKAYYEGLVGKLLAPSQSETLIVNGLAYRELMLRVAGNEACKQMLLAFAVYPALDYLGEFFNVERLPASAAECTLAFTMVDNNPPLVIPAGVRVQSTDGKAVFITLAAITVGSDSAPVSVIAQCTTDGVAGNDYQPGDISIILDPQAFVASCANSDVTNAGEDAESDDALRERIRLAPSAFSVAGPDGAYKFFAKSANPGIIDVAITSPNPGDVAITALMTGGVIPSEEVAGQILAKCNAEKARPLNDNVYILNPTAVNYALTVHLVTLTDAIDDSILALVNANLNAYVLERKTHLGIDIVISQIIGKCMVDQVYEAVIVSPSADVILDETEFGNCTGINVSITGQSDE